MYYFVVIFLAVCSIITSQVNAGVCQRSPTSGATNDNAIDICTESTITASILYIDTGFDSTVALDRCSCSISVNSSGVEIKSLIVPEDALCATTLSFDIDNNRQIGCEAYKAFIETTTVNEGSVELSSIGPPNKESGYCIKLNAERGGGVVTLSCNVNTKIQSTSFQTGDAPPIEIMEELLTNSNQTKEAVFEEIQRNENASVLFEPLFPSHNFDDINLNNNQSLSDNDNPNISMVNSSVFAESIHASESIKMKTDPIPEESSVNMHSQIKDANPSSSISSSKQQVEEVVSSSSIKSANTVDDWAMFLSTELRTTTIETLPITSLPKASSSTGKTIAAAMMDSPISVDHVINTVPLLSGTILFSSTAIYDGSVKPTESIMENTSALRVSSQELKPDKTELSSTVPSSIAVAPTRTSSLYEAIPTTSVPVSSEIVMLSNDSGNVFKVKDKEVFEISTESITIGNEPSNTSTAGILSKSSILGNDTGNVTTVYNREIFETTVKSNIEVAINNKETTNQLLAERTSSESPMLRNDTVNFFEVEDKKLIDTKAMRLTNETSNSTTQFHLEATNPTSDPTQEKTSRKRAVPSFKTKETTTSFNPVLINDTGSMHKFKDEEIIFPTMPSENGTTVSQTPVVNTNTSEVSNSPTPILINDTGNVFKVEDLEFLSTTTVQNSEQTATLSAEMTKGIETTSHSPILINDTGNVFKIEDLEILSTTAKNIDRTTILGTEVNMKRDETTSHIPILINDTGNVFKIEDLELLSTTQTNIDRATILGAEINTKRDESTSHIPILINDTGNVFKIEDLEFLSTTTQKNINRMTILGAEVNTKRDESSSHIPILINDTGNVFKIEDVETISTTTVKNKDQSTTLGAEINTNWDDTAVDSSNSRVKDITSSLSNSKQDTSAHTELPGTSAPADHPMEILPLVPESNDHDNTVGLMSNIDKNTLDKLFRGTANILLSTTKEPVGPGVRENLERQGDEEDHLSDETVTIIVIGSVVGILALIACIVILTTCLTKKRKANNMPLDNDVEMNGKGIDNPLMDLGNEVNSPSNGTAPVNKEPEKVIKATPIDENTTAEKQNGTAKAEDSDNAKL